MTAMIKLKVTRRKAAAVFSTSFIFLGKRTLTACADRIEIRAFVAHVCTHAYAGIKLPILEILLKGSAPPKIINHSDLVLA